MISEETIQSIVTKVALSEVARDYFPVKRRGSQFWAVCPFHNERSPSFCINDRKNVYKCWGCGAGGGVIRFVMEMDRISFPEAVRKLGQIAGVAIVEEESEQDKIIKQLLAANHKASDFFFQSLVGRGGAEAREQLKARGFNRTICEEWGIGYAPEVYTLDGDSAVLSKVGLTYENGANRFQNRIMFGIRNEHGSIVGFSGRTTNNHPAKYLNSPDSPVFSKGKIFYGLQKAKRSIIDSGEVVIVEGQIDVIRCHLHGLNNTIAPLGTAFTNAHGAAVRRLCGSAVLVFDADKAGQEAARKAFAVLAQAGVNVKALVLPNKQDPDEFILTGGNMAEAVSKATSYPEALASSLSIKTAEDKVTAMKKVGFAISRLDEEVIRDSMATKLAGVIGVAPSDLRKHVAMAGGHEAIPTQSIGAMRTEGFRHLISHLLFCGKEKARQYNWSIINEPVIHKILESEYEAGNMPSITKVLASLDSSVESSICGVSKSEMESVDIRGVYKTMLEQTIKTTAEEVASTGEIDRLSPLLETLKQLN